MKIEIIDKSEMPKAAGTTVGYWMFSRPRNKGRLTIFVLKTSDWRFTLAVLGHEIIEAFYCWFRGITTEECDKFDIMIEAEYDSGKKPASEEGGFDKRSPYRWGHILGAGWEYIAIYGTFASWKKYINEMNKLMGI